MYSNLDMLFLDEAQSINKPSPPALPPRNKARPTLDEEEVVANESRSDSLPLSQPLTKSDDSSYLNDADVSCISGNSF